MFQLNTRRSKLHPHISSLPHVASSFDNWAFKVQEMCSNSKPFTSSHFNSIKPSLKCSRFTKFRKVITRQLSIIVFSPIWVHFKNRLLFQSAWVMECVEQKGWPYLKPMLKQTGGHLLSLILFCFNTYEYQITPNSHSQHKVYLIRKFETRHKIMSDMM